MKLTKRAFYRLSIVAVAFLGLIGLGVLIYAQEAPTEKMGVVDDWTHHHLVFSNPGTEADAIKNGRYEHWYNVTHDPRYQLQQLKRSHPQQAVAPAVSAAPADFASRLAAVMAAKPTPDSKPKRNPIKKDWSTGLGTASATQTGTFIGSSGTGNVVVNGTTLTASAGSAASQTTIIASNGAGNGSTITITNPLVGSPNSPLVLTASTPVAEIDEIAFGSTPANNSYVTITGVNYEFKTANWSGTVTSGYCFIRTSSTTSTMVSELGSAITSGSANGGTSSTSTWQCGTSATQSATTGVSVSSTTSSAVYVQANTPGASGFTAPSTNGTTHLTITHNSTTGTNGSSTSPYFQWWSGAGPAPAATLATNIYNAIGSANAVGVGATNPSSGHVVITGTLTGQAGNSISVATSITSGLTGTGSAAFNGNLSGGTSGTTSGTTFSTSTDSTTQSTNLASEAAALASAIKTNVSAVTATATGATVEVIDKTAGSGGDSIALTGTLSSTFSWAGGTLVGGGASAVQPNAYPAKYGASLTTASCSSDFAVYPTGAVGNAGEASIVAYNNLYTTGCTGTVPSVYWAYNTGGTVTTSPVFSEDGTQMAFIQSNGTTASLVLLKWAAETGETVTSPLTLTNQSSASAYHTCSPSAADPCMYTLAFANSENDTFSAPFYEYGDDFLFVGDDSGNLHQFTGVFNGSPAESGSPWPVSLGTNKLSSPVYDTEYGFQGGYVFVGDMGGVFYSVGTGYGGTTNGQTHGNTGSIGDVIADAPLIDASEGEAFVFVTTNGSYSYTGDNGVWQFVTSFTTLASPGVVYAGTGGSGYYLYDGTFDNVYYESGNPAAGHLYVVGNTGTAGGGTLYQLEIMYSSLTGNVIAVATGLNSTEHPWPSPVTEFCNNGANPCSLTQRTVSGSLSTTSPNVTLTSGTFTGADLGAQIWASPSNALYGATITSILSSTTANLIYGAPSNQTGQTFTIQDEVTTSGTDYIFFSINSGTGSGCTSGAGNGCVLSYNVSSTFHAATGKTTSGSKSVTSTSGISSTDVGGTIAGVGIPGGDTITAYASGTATLATAATASTTGALLTITPLLTQTGSGLNVKTPATNGCWATSAMVIDNSDPTTTGADQVYFVGLNGASSAATGTNCTSGTANLNGTQASQSNP